MNTQELLDNYRQAIIALEPYFKKLNIEPRGHDWSEAIIGSMFYGMVDLPIKEKDGFGVHALELCDYQPSEKANKISYIIKSGSEVLTLDDDSNHWIETVIDKDTLIDELIDFRYVFSEDPFIQLNYTLGKSKKTEFNARYEDCLFK